MKNQYANIKQVADAHLFNLKPLRLALTVALGLGATGLVYAATIPLAQAPASNSNKPPIPNLIVSVDDSGSMGSSGMATLRAALNESFNTDNVKDGDVRVAWQTMSGDCRAIPSNIGRCGNKNGMDLFQGQHRLDFNAWVATLAPTGATPTHRIMTNAGTYMSSPLGINNPWASDPGNTELPYLGCRKTYHALMTDGGWNSSPYPAAGNFDGTAKTLPDGTTYTPNTSQTRYISDDWGASGAPTLSDLAWQQWSTDLQPGIANQVVPDIKVPGTTALGLTQYWNPRNDPANWQHIVTFTLGFNTASEWPVDNAQTAVFVTDTYSGDFPGLVSGAKKWYNPISSNEARRAQELWHMALSSRGEFVPASGTGVENLVAAFKRIIKVATGDTSQLLTSIAQTGSSLNSGFDVFESGYEASSWTGKLVAFELVGGTSQPSSTPKWNAATLLDTLTDNDIDNRLIITQNGTTAVSFKYANLSLTQKLAFNGLGLPTTGAERVDYIRGKKVKEQTAGPYRTRKSRLGDIVNSAVWYTAGPNLEGTLNGYDQFRTTFKARMPMVYVGSNDGMLHGFSASTNSAEWGREKLAYIPNALVTQLNPLTDPAYVHRYYVDGSPFTGDAYMNGGWKTYLVSGLGAGGKGYFILDVTNPATFTEANATNLVINDTTSLNNADIGNITARPVSSPVLSSESRQFAKMSANTSYVFMGNGYNSTNERAALVAQSLEKNATPTIIPVELTTGQGNGLGPPLLIDLNGDRKVDVAYAGDLKGRMWKFDLTSTNSAAWKVALAGQPLFTAKSPSGVVQPITTAPSFKFSKTGGVMISFGTGRNLSVSDRSDTQVQTIYSVLDNSDYTEALEDPTTKYRVITLTSGTANLTRANLVQQTITASGSDYKTTINAVTYTGVGAKSGWFADLPSQMRTSSNAGSDQQGLFNIHTFVPGSGGNAVESCDPIGNGLNYLFRFDAFYANTKASLFSNGATGVNGVLVSSDSSITAHGDGEDSYIHPGKVDKDGNILPTESTKVPNTVDPAFAGWREIP